MLKNLLNAATSRRALRSWFVCSGWKWEGNFLFIYMSRNVTGSHDQLRSVFLRDLT